MLGCSAAAAALSCHAWLGGTGQTALAADGLLAVCVGTVQLCDAAWYAARANVAADAPPMVIERGELHVGHDTMLRQCSCQCVHVPHVPVELEASMWLAVVFSACVLNAACMGWTVGVARLLPVVRPAMNFSLMSAPHVQFGILMSSTVLRCG